MQKDGEKFHTYIKIKEAEYFKHGCKQDELSSRQRKELYIFLKSKPESEDDAELYENNWKLLIHEWNRNNSKEKVSKDYKMPDYTKL